MADKALTNPMGAFGYTDLTTTSYQLEFQGKASAAITGPVCVSLGTTGEIATTATDGTAGLCIGIAVQSIASGSVGGVVILGLAENVTAEGTIAAGAIVKRSATTAGAVAATATPGVGEALGVAINASAGGTVDVWVGSV